MMLGIAQVITHGNLVDLRDHAVNLVLKALTLLRHFLKVRCKITECEGTGLKSGFLNKLSGMRYR